MHHQPYIDYEPYMTAPFDRTLYREALLGLFQSQMSDPRIVKENKERARLAAQHKYAKQRKIFVE